MEVQLQIFTNEEFGQVRILGDFENPLFCLSDLCRILDLRVAKVIERLNKDVPSKDPLSKGEPSSDNVLSKHPVQTAGGIQNMYFVNEDGFYDVILESRKPIAKRLRKWVTRDILPSIRKTGSYSVYPTKKVSRPLSPTACVYALLMSNGTVKIGHTGNIRQRVAKIKRQTGLTVNKLHFTFEIARETARTIEWACQENFSSQRMKGEFFNIEFAEICNVIDSSLKIQIERNDNLLKIADKMESSSERHLILIRAANFFVGQCSA